MNSDSDKRSCATTKLLGLPIRRVISVTVPCFRPAPAKPDFLVADCRPINQDPRSDGFWPPSADAKNQTGCWLGLRDLLELTYFPL